MSGWHWHRRLRVTLEETTSRRPNTGSRALCFRRKDILGVDRQASATNYSDAWSHRFWQKYSNQRYGELLLLDYLYYIIDYYYYLLELTHLETY
jgi:hypothetical protein